VRAGHKSNEPANNAFGNFTGRRVDKTAEADYERRIVIIIAFLSRLLRSKNRT
jgi:hypothetical protein